VKKASQPYGLCLQSRHSALLVAYLQPANDTPRAWIDEIEGTTVMKIKRQQTQRLAELKKPTAGDAVGLKVFLSRRDKLAHFL